MKIKFRLLLLFLESIGIFIECIEGAASVVAYNHALYDRELIDVNSTESNIYVI